MSGLSSLLLTLADWLGAHGVPTLAGFVGGLAGSEFRARWVARRAKKDQPKPD